MTTLTHRAQGPDKKAAEMSDSDEAGHANRANGPAVKAGGTQAPAGTTDPADRKRRRAWVPGTAALLTALIGLSDIIGIFRPDLAHRLHKINYLVPGTLITVTRTAHVLIGLMLLMLAHGLRRRKRRAWQAVAALLAFDIAIRFLHSQQIFTAIVAIVVLIALLYFRDEFYAEGDHRTRWRALWVFGGADRGGRRHRPDLHPAGPGAGGGLLAEPAGGGSHHRPGRGVGTGSVGARGAWRPVRHPHQRARDLHPPGHRVPVPAPGRAQGEAGRRGRGPDQGTAGQARGQGLAWLLRAARRQERDLVADRQGLHLLPRRVRGDAGQRRPDRRPGGLARRDRSLPGRGQAARLGAGRDGLQRARRGGVVP